MKIGTSPRSYLAQWPGPSTWPGSFPRPSPEFAQSRMPGITILSPGSPTIVSEGKDGCMSTRTRKDLICLSIGAENVATLKDAAAREGIPASALVRQWISAHQEAEDE